MSRLYDRGAMHLLPRAPQLQPAVAAERNALERFIAERFRAVYGARITHFCAQLLGMRGADGAWHAAAGYTAARKSELFLEQYLDARVEEVLGSASGRCVQRTEVVEVGNLAARIGMGRLLIPALGAHLYDLGFRWVVFTGTRELHNAFRRLRLEPVVLAPALPSRLSHGAGEWGSYYAHAPAVMGGPLAACLRLRSAA